MDNLEFSEAAVEELERELERLRAETFALDEYCRSVEPQLEELERVEARDQKNRRRKAKAAQLPVSDKISVALATQSHLREAIGLAKETTQRLVDNIETMLEAQDEQEGEARKDMVDLKRSMVGTEKDHVPTTQRMIKHFEERLRTKEQTIDKLEVKNGVIKRKITQSENVVKSKEGQGDNLSTIDFDHLQIENQELLDKIEMRNMELLALKQASGKTTLQLNTFKQALSKTTAYAVWLQDQRLQKQNQIEKAVREMEEVAVDLRKEQRTHQRLEKEHDEGTAVPEVLEYVRVNIEVRDIKHEVKNWKQRLEVQSGAMNLLRQKTIKSEASRRDRYIDDLSMQAGFLQKNK